MEEPGYKARQSDSRVQGVLSTGNSVCTNFLKGLVYLRKAEEFDVTGSQTCQV